jgi:predicted phosphodiesterase
MRVAALYDIHGNLPALEAVLDEVRAIGVDRLIVGGDVLPGPMPRETIACLASAGIPASYIQGNGDRETVAWRRGTESAAIPEPYRESMRWNADQLSPDDERRIDAWPATVRLEIPGIGDVFFCHATPRNDVDIFTRLTPAEQLAPIFDPVGAPVVVCGHTHMQFDRMVGTTRIVNAGSVGMPFQAAGAYWLLLGPDVELRVTAYDLPKAAERIRATAYPKAEEFAARNVLAPPAEAAMVDAFTRVPLTASA